MGIEQTNCNIVQPVKADPRSVINCSYILADATVVASFTFANGNVVGCESLSRCIEFHLSEELREAFQTKFHLPNKHQLTSMDGSIAVQ